MVLKRHIAKFQRFEIIHWNRIGRLWILWNRKNVPEVLQRHFGLAIRIDDVAELLQRTEDEEGIDEQ